MTICLLEYGKRIPLWDAVYSEDYALVQKIMGSVDGPPQVNIPHGVSIDHTPHDYSFFFFF
jgi:hypothetical protein